MGSLFPTTSVPSLGDEAHVVLDSDQHGQMRLCIWLDSPIADLYVRRGSFWIEVAGGGPEAPAWWWRFDFAFAAFSRACFAMAEVRPALAQEHRPEGAWLFSAWT